MNAEGSTPLRNGVWSSHSVAQRSLSFLYSVAQRSGAVLPHCRTELERGHAQRADKCLYSDSQSKPQCRGDTKAPCNGRSRGYGARKGRSKLGGGCRRHARPMQGRRRNVPPSVNQALCDGSRRTFAAPCHATPLHRPIPPAPSPKARHVLLEHGISALARCVPRPPPPHRNERTQQCKRMEPLLERVGTSATLVEASLPLILVSPGPSLGSARNRGRAAASNNRGCRSTDAGCHPPL